jgi:hypothetical protein
MIVLAAFHHQHLEHAGVASLEVELAVRMVVVEVLSDLGTRCWRPTTATPAGAS